MHIPKKRDWHHVLTRRKDLWLRHVDVSAPQDALVLVHWMHKASVVSLDKMCVCPHHHEVGGPHLLLPKDVGKGLPGYQKKGVQHVLALKVHVD